MRMIYIGSELTARQTLQTIFIALAFAAFWDPLAAFAAFAAFLSRFVADLAPFLYLRARNDGGKESDGGSKRASESVAVLIRKYSSYPPPMTPIDYCNTGERNE